MWESAINQEGVKSETKPKSHNEWRRNQWEQFTKNYPEAHKWTEANTLEGKGMRERLFGLSVLTPYVTDDLKH